MRGNMSLDRRTEGRTADCSSVRHLFPACLPPSLSVCLSIVSIHLSLSLSAICVPEMQPEDHRRNSPCGPSRAASLLLLNAAELVSAHP